MSIHQEKNMAAPEKRDLINNALDTLSKCVSELEGFVDGKIAGEQILDGAEGTAVGYNSDPPLGVFLDQLPEQINRIYTRIDNCRCRLDAALCEVPPQPSRATVGGGPAHG